MVERFLAEHSEFELAPLPVDVFTGIDPEGCTGMVQILPQQFHSDGFFIADCINVTCKGQGRVFVPALC